MDSAKRCIGCFVGLLVGDAGATLDIADVRPGQFTDDSELAIHLLIAIHDKDPKDGFPSESIAQEYIKWYNSTTFGFAQSNMSRVAPLAIWLWAHGVDEPMIISYARQEAAMSHPNNVCQDVNALFCLALVSLMSQPGDHMAAIASVERHLGSVSSIVQTWYTDAISIKNIECEQNICAFMLAFFFLKHKYTYEHAIYETLKKGGDTDTNAAIVGAMMGALHGYDVIPNAMKDAVLAFDCTTNKGHSRPGIYRAKHALEVLRSIYNNEKLLR